MGGCVVSMLSTVDHIQRVKNPHIERVRAIPAQSVEVSSNEGRPESGVRRSPSMADLKGKTLFDHFYGAGYGSMGNWIAETVAKYPNRRALAWRPIEREEKAEIEEGGKKKPWTFIHLKETQYVTYQEFWNRVNAFGNALLSVGLKPGERIGIYEETRAEWLISCYGLWSQGFTGVTVYANLGEDALEYAIREAELPAIFLNGKAVKTLVNLCKAKGIKTPVLIYTDALPVDFNADGLNIYSFDDLVQQGLKLGAAAKPNNFTKNPDDLALIMYTSGTTGDPKGVMISHGNVVAAAASLSKRLSDFIDDASGDSTYLAYLPLAHILEFTAENIFLSRGFTVGYGNPRTLTDTSARPHGDLREYKPQIMCGVPRVFDTIKKAVESKLPAEGTLPRRVFDRAYAERKAALAKGEDTPYWNNKVFGKLRDLLGGNVKGIVSGGAPLSAQTHEFLSVVFGCAVSQGYGLTETTAACTIERYYDLTTENAGGLISSCEVKLRDVETWTHKNPRPQGEVLIRGPTITKGYFKQPEKTKEAFLEDGWFATGDVGQFEPNGTLRIVGRVKALAKNSLGEYIALEALESTYVLDDLLLPNGVCVLVDPHKAFICAVGLTDQNKAMKFAAKHGLAGEWPAIINSAEFQKKAAESMAATAKKAGKKPLELVRAVRIYAEEWTPENGMLTAAMKLKRRCIEDRYKTDIAKLFADNDR